MSLRARFRALRENRPAFLAVASVLLVVHLAWPAVDWWLRAAEIATPFRFFDWGAYGGAIDRWQANEWLYERNDEGGFHGTYLYPPVVLVLFRPFSALPFSPEAWGLCSLALLWAGTVAVIERLVGRRSWPERLLVLWLLVGFQPLLFSLKMGQTAAFMGGLLCFAFVALDREADRASGVLTGAVGVVKFAYAPVGAHLLADRDRFLGAVGAGIVLVALSFLLFGVEIHRRYLDVLAWGVGQGGQARSPALWLPAYYRPLGWLDGALVVRVVVSLAVALYALLAVDADRETFALGVAAFPLVTPLAYTYYFVALVPAALVLIHGELARDGRPVVPTLGLLFVSVHAYGLYAITELLPAVAPGLASVPKIYFFLQPGLWGNLLLFATAFVRVGERVVLPEWVPERFVEA